MGNTKHACKCLFYFLVHKSPFISSNVHVTHIHTAGGYSVASSAGIWTLDNSILFYSILFSDTLNTIDIDYSRNANRDPVMKWNEVML